MRKILLGILFTIFLTSCGMPDSNTVVIETNMGTIKAELYAEKVPETVKNFKFHVKEGNYDGVIFHRIINDFMLQTGDFENQNGSGGYSYKGPGTTIEDEFDDSLKHEKGVLSMANRGPNTGGSQFFIVHAGTTPWLDGLHAIFGKVTEGIEIVDKIAVVDTDFNDKPLEDVVIEKAYLE